MLGKGVPVLATCPTGQGHELGRITAAAHEQAPTCPFDLRPDGNCALRPGPDKHVLFPCFHAPTIDHSYHLHLPMRSVSSCLRRCWALYTGTTLSSCLRGQN